MNETPAMLSTVYASNTIGLGDTRAWGQQFGLQERRVANNPIHALLLNQTPTEDKPIMAAANSRRLVQVFIADVHDSVPLADALLYSGEAKFTDLTDQELFFEIDITSILKAHNDKRTKMVNKAVKERVEHLEPARIRDLKMTVVNIATF